MARQRLSRAQSRAQTRQDLLAAAGEVFVRRGFAAATLEEIAAAAGYTKGAAYYNYADKEAMFLALFDQRIDANLRTVAASLDGAETATDADAALRATIERLSAVEPGWNLLVVEFWLYAMRHPDAHRRLTEHQQRLREHIASLFARQCERAGITPAVPLADLATLLLAADAGLAQFALTEPDLNTANLYENLIGLLRRAAVHGWNTDDSAPSS